MEFLKRNIKWIILVIALMIVVSGVSVYATSTYLASQVTYTKNEKTMSVEEALNDLYNKSTLNIQDDNLELIGTYSLDSTHVGSYSKTFDLKEYDNYQNLQNGNFYVVIEKIAVAGGSGKSNSTTNWLDVEKSYNSDTGIVTITIPFECYNGYGVWLKGSVYLKK